MIAEVMLCFQVFVSDKKRSKEFGGTEPFSRIKKELMKEMKGISADDQVLVMGCSSCPQICVKKDEKAFINFFEKHIYCPIPEYASRTVGSQHLTVPCNLATSYCPEICIKRDETAFMHSFEKHIDCPTPEYAPCTVLSSYKTVHCLLDISASAYADGVVLCSASGISLGRYLFCKGCLESLFVSIYIFLIGKLFCSRHRDLDSTLETQRSLGHESICDTTHI